MGSQSILKVSHHTDACTKEPMNLPRSISDRSGFVLPGAGGMTAVEVKGTFWGDGNVLYFYGGDGYMALYICQGHHLYT